MIELPQKVTSPCKGCDERTVEPNCHTLCERYIAYTLKLEEERAARFAATSDPLTNLRYDGITKHLQKRKATGKRKGRK